MEGVMSILEKINHQIAGEPGAPRLVLLHGLMGSAANWQRAVNQFSRRFEVLTYDQRGHGRSWHPESDYAPDDFAEDLRLLMKELGWSQSFVLGHSMGGRNALVFASRYPELCQKLILEDIGPDGDQMNVDRITRMLEAVPAPFADRETAKSYFDGDFRKGPGQEFASPDVMARYLYSNLRKGADDLWNWRFSKQGVVDALRLGRATETWEEWQSLKCPVLVLRGEKSVEFRKEVYLRMLEALPHAKGIVFDDCGHWIHHERPEEFVKTVVEFLCD